MEREYKEKTLHIEDIAISLSTGKRLRIYNEQSTYIRFIYLDIIDKILTSYFCRLFIGDAKIPGGKDFITEGIKLTTAFNVALLKVLGKAANMQKRFF